MTGGNMNTPRILAALVVVSALGALPAQADTALTLKAGTLGYGLELNQGLSERFALRLGYNTYSSDYDMTEDQIDYRFDSDFKSVSALVDWHPFKGVFRVSAGYVANSSSFQGTGTPQSGATYDIGGTTYTATEVGTLGAAVDFTGGPYVGIGWGSSPKGSGFALSFDIGVVAQDAPEMRLFSTGGTLSNDPTFQANLATEQGDAQDGLDEFELYPVISLGLGWRF
jgi:hypothetical protein